MNIRFEASGSSFLYYDLFMRSLFPVIHYKWEKINIADYFSRG